MNIIKEIKKLASQYIAEIFIVIGLAFLISTTIAINTYIGLYLISSISILLGWVIAKKR